MKFDFNVIISIISGLIVCIPLIIKLVTVATQAVRNKNWNYIISLLSTYIVAAEKLAQDGATKKAWVMSMLKASASKIDYDLTEADYAKIENLIDELISMTKQVNVPDVEENS